MHKGFVSTRVKTLCQTPYIIATIQNSIPSYHHVSVDLGYCCKVIPANLTIMSVWTWDTVPRSYPPDLVQAVRYWHVLAAIYLVLYPPWGWQQNYDICRYCSSFLIAHGTSILPWNIESYIHRKAISSLAIGVRMQNSVKYFVPILQKLMPTILSWLIILEVVSPMLLNASFSLGVVGCPCRQCW